MKVSKKMEIIIHRVNNISKLQKIPNNYGIEIDVRDYKNKLILNHDPFKNGTNLEPFLKFGAAINVWRAITKKN